MKFNLTEKGFQTNFKYGELQISSNDDDGFRPFQLMVSSIIGCSGATFRKILEKQRIEIEDMQISAELERNPNEANRIEEIQLNYIVKGPHLDEKKTTKISSDCEKKLCHGSLDRE